MARRFGILAAGVLATLARASSAGPFPDIVVYADHQPPTVTSNPFVSKEFSDDPETKILLEVIPGLQNPLGTANWEVYGWGKYVLLSNYDEAYRSFDQDIADQRIGILDTEKKTFCQLDLDPNAAVNASVQALAVATPEARQSRIYFEGIGNPAFGFITANLDSPNPCDPAAWPTVGFTRNDINLAAVHLGPAKAPCPGLGNRCSFDGMRLLRHDPVTGTDTLAIHQYGAGKIVIVKVDALGHLSVPDVYNMQFWVPEATNGACMFLQPVSHPVVDPTRLPNDPNDLRFTSGFDVECNVDFPGCAPWVGLCPGQGTSCTVGSDTCPTFTCSNTHANCTTNADCTTLVSTGNCTNACKRIHPGFTCSTTRSKHCARSDDCPAGEACVCGDGSPLQEFRFDGTSITTTSPLFQAAPSSNDGILTYDNAGELWTVSGPTPLGTGTTSVVRYAKNPSTGEHAYFAENDPAGTEVFPPSATFPFEAASPILGTPKGALHLGGHLYSAGFWSTQRQSMYFGAWFSSAFKVSMGVGALSAEPKACTGGANNGKHCLSGANCPGGTCTIVSTIPGGQFWPQNIGFGGAPPSMWIAPRFAAGKTSVNAYLIRIPREVPVPDGSTWYRPGIAWSSSTSCPDASCDRLWMVAEHDTVLEFRVRDDGVWSGWYPLPSNIVTAGGASVLFYNGSVELFGRSSAGTVITTKLTSPLNCAPASCTWASWSVVPGSPVTDKEPAAEVQGTVGPFIAIRRQSDGRVMFARRTSSGWSGWFMAGSGVLTDAAPALVWNPVTNTTGRMWVFARDQATGGISHGKIAGLDFVSWSPLPTSGYEPWYTAPQAIWDGNRMRVFIAKSPFPNYVYQITNDNTAWDAWTPLFTEAQSTHQAAAAMVNGDLNLVTSWYVAGMAEQLVK